MSRRKPTKVAQWFSANTAKEMWYLKGVERSLDQQINDPQIRTAAAEAEQRYIDDVHAFADAMAANRAKREEEKGKP
jgi:hypothetical protein